MGTSGQLRLPGNVESKDSKALLSLQCCLGTPQIGRGLGLVVLLLPYVASEAILHHQLQTSLGAMQPMPGRSRLWIESHTHSAYSSHARATTSYMLPAAQLQR